MRSKVFLWRVGVRSRMGMGITEKAVERIVAQFFCPCLLKM
ncbi:hypothetical protein [Okeania sp. SIO2C2]|nr:hypothetical protein [Okeania sp. SIO2C2]